MADLTVGRGTLAAPAALTPVAAAGGGDRFNPGSNSPVFLYVVNAHSASWDVTIDDPNTQAPEDAAASNPDSVTTVPNAANRLIPIRNPERFRDANGWINVSYTGVTALTVAVFT